MALFVLLIFPTPFNVKRKIFTCVNTKSGLPLLRGFELTKPSFISENPVVAKIQYWMKITFIFILILFIDSVNRVYRVQVELAAASEQAKQGGGYVTPRN